MLLVLVVVVLLLANMVVPRRPLLLPLEIGPFRQAWAILLLLRRGRSMQPPARP